MDFVRRLFGPDATAVEIAGDASTRRFFRVTSRAGTDTVVLMVHGEPLAPDAPLFSNHGILSAIGAPVPEIFGRNEPLGLVLVEDFGDTTLQRHLLDATGLDPKNRIEMALPLYIAACDLIGLMQARAGQAMRPDDFAARNALDRDRFLFELGHFDRHFIRGLRGLTPTPSEERLLQAFYEDLASACDRLPRVYCHRDYQSRNLMVRSGGRLGLVDFQDARMGPYAYDAASLLRDSSLDLDPGLVEQLLDRLVETIGKPLAIGREEFRRDFDLVALQRNIKDLGTFGYMATIRGRRDYLEYVPRTQESIRRTMTASERWHLPFELVSRLALSPLT
ncbi:MAG TPA: phosphotransferase [Verrucomicrobiae bacterium]|nr:phosphotransferase [Verrucomicrobiae bacterium]